MEVHEEAKKDMVEAIYNSKVRKNLNYKEKYNPLCDIHIRKRF